MRSLRMRVLLFAVWSAWALPGYCGQNLAATTLVYPCLPAPGPIMLDGRLDKAEWGHAVEAAGFTVSGSDRPVPEPVLMRLTYDRDRLYLGITCMESNMKGLKTGGAGQRDGAFWFDDSVEFFVDANHDHKSYCQFAVTAKGILYDNRQGDSTWNADWQAATMLEADRWTVEIAVSLADLAPGGVRAGTLWGFNFCRERQAGGRLELYNWANVEGVFKTVERFGHLAFVGKGWRATAERVAQVVRDAGGKESRLFVEDGFWVARTGEAPVFVPFLEQLRRLDRTAPPFLAKLATVYAAAPGLPDRDRYAKIKARYAKVRQAVTGDRPLRAAVFDRHALTLSTLQVEAEALYWRAKLAELNRAMQ
ncbi:MAG: hypothetical protein GXP31_06940 [Kiritimatiellaeota bacterium]|nr:hypothetical protein [Kiritimatiellota bacterium]